MVRRILAAFLLAAALPASSPPRAHAQAQDALENSLRSAEYSRDPRAIVGALIDLARYNREQGRARVALDYARRALAAAQSAASLPLVDRAWEEVIACQERAGDTSGALASFRRYQEEHDRLAADEAGKRLAQVEARYQTERKAADAERAQRDRNGEEEDGQRGGARRGWHARSIASVPLQ